MSNAVDLKKRYLQMAQNNQAGTSQYLNNQKLNATNQMASVIASKYNNPGQVDVNKGFYEYGQNLVPNYNNQNDTELAARYNKAQTDYNNALIAQENLNNLQQQRVDANNQASLAYQQAQKYGNSQLAMQGLNNTGLSESSTTGLLNTYANVLARNNQDYYSGVNQTYKDLADANLESSQQLNNELLRQQENKQLEEKQILSDAIANAPDLDVLNKYMEAYGKNLDPNLNILYNMKVKELENQEQETLKPYYGIASDAVGIDPSKINASTFAYKGSGTSGKQDKHLDLVLKNIRWGYIKNGDVVDLNLGEGSDNYIYFNGMLYKTNKKANYTPKETMDETIWS